jgi:hypothetical protein
MTESIVDDNILENTISNEIELTEQIMAQRLEIEEKKRTINMLEKALVIFMIQI